MIGEQVTILRAGAPTEDRYGNAVPGADTRIAVVGCAVAPRESTDSPDPSRTGVIVGHTVLFPAGTDVRSSDRLEFRGKEHDIDGEPGEWTNPFTGRHFGVQVATHRAEG